MGSPVDEEQLRKFADKVIESRPEIWQGINFQAIDFVRKIRLSGRPLDSLPDSESGPLSQMIEILGKSEFDRRIGDLLHEARLRRAEAQAVEIETKRRMAEEAINAERERLALIQDQRDQAVKRLSVACGNWFQNDFLNADSLFEQEFGEFDLSEDYRVLKSAYLKRWFALNAESSGRFLPELDAEQLQAIGAVDGNFQVIARAGSGKTLVSVLRAYFLIKHCNVRPDKILLLAFNREAALEIRRRLLFLFKPEAAKLYKSGRSKLLASGEKGRKSIFDIENEVVVELVETLGIELPFAMTFHALAYAITRPEGAVLMDDPDSKDKSLSATVQGLVDEVLKDDDKARSIRDLMMQHFRHDWEFLNSKEYGMSGEELLLWRRSLPNQTIDGRYRKSPGEKVISDFLFEHGVEYHYERNVWWGDTNYKPDFTILRPGSNKSGLVIEYFGLNDEAYVEQIEQKRKFWQKKESWELIELYPKDLAKGIENLASILAPQIKALGIPVNKLTDEEIWKLIEDDAILQYTGLLKGFITRCRQIGWDSERLGQEISIHSADSKSIEGLFLKQAGYMFGAYETTLKAKRETDFSKLIADAVQQIESGATAFYRRSGNGNLASLRYVFVDEFQDFSFLFDSMVKAIFNINNQVSLFCVGDNWQAINGFAGSDLNYFYNFLESIPNSRRIYLSTNYRSDANIVHFGNTIMDTMSGFDKDAIASKPKVNLPLIGYLDEFVPTATERERSENELITPALLRIINSQLVLDRDVVVLARAKNIPYYTDASESGRKVKNLDSFLEHLQSFFPEELSKRISISTAHRYKGRERQAVIILDANEKRYPLIHRDWIFSQIFGLSIATLIDDDRRLFYVSATRAIEQLFMISESHESLTPYVQEFGNGHAALDWSEYGVPASKVNPLIVQVTGSTFAIKEHLSACGYRFMAASKVWQKAFLPEAFSVGELKNQSWAHHQVDGPDTRIQVLITKEPQGEIAHFEVVRGVWVTNFNRLELIENESTNDED